MALTETFHAGGYIASESAGTRSREAAVLLSGQNLKAGAVLGKATKAGTATVTFAGTGNGVFTKDATTPVLAGAKPGAYRVVCIEPATDLGTFVVFDPDGIEIGRYVVGAAAFATQIKFTIADGSADFVAGDAFNFVVDAGSGKHKEYNPANTDGSETALAVLFDAVDATAGDKPCVISARDTEVTSAMLLWFSGASGGQKTTGLAQLALQGIVGR